VCLHPFRYRSGEMDSLLHTHDEYNVVFCLKVRAEFFQPLEPARVRELRSPHSPALWSV
jgi:hypothetical protein